MNKHTELPYRVDDEINGGIGGKVYITGTCNGKPTSYAVAVTHGMTDNEAEANAAFIVRVCNLHDELLDALRLLADASATIGNLDHAGVPVPADAWADMYRANCKARAAIAKAERGRK